MAGELDHAAVGRERAAQDREAAALLEAAAAGGPPPARGSRPTLGRPRPSEPAMRHASLPPAPGADELRTRAPASRRPREHIGGDVAAARLQVGDDRRARGNRVEVLERQLEAELLRNREQVEHPVGRSAGRRPRRSRSRGQRGHDLRGPGVGANEIHHQLAGLRRGRALPVAVAGMPLGTGGLIPRKSIASAIVVAVNCRRSFGTGARDRSRVVRSSSFIVPAARAPTAFGGVLDRHVRPRKSPGAIEPL